MRENKGIKKNNAGSRRIKNIKGIFSVILIITILLVAAGVMLFYRERSFFVKLDGYVVPKEEYLMVMNRLSYEVEQGIYARYGLQRSNAFWSTKLDDGMQPLEILAEKTLEALKRRYAIYRLAQEQGYVADISYDAIVGRLMEENRIRSEKKRLGEPVYGLMEYSLDTFMDYEENSIRTRYCNDDEILPMQVPEAELHRMYEQKKEVLFVTKERRKIGFILMEESIGEDYRAILEEMASKPEQMWEQIENDPKWKEFYGEVELTQDDDSIQEHMNRLVVALSADLQQGERSEVTAENGVICVAECIGFTPEGYVPFETARFSLQAERRQEIFEELIEQKMAQMECEMNMEQLYRLTKKYIAS